MADNRMIVAVVGDTKQLTRDLAGAESQLKRFSARTSTIRGRGADKLLADVRSMRTEGDLLNKRLGDIDAANQRVAGSFRGAGAGALLAGVAVNTLGRNLSETGGEAGRFGNALSALTTGNFVGFYKAVRDNTAALKGYAAELVEGNDSVRAHAEANKFAAAGFDQVAKAAREAAKQIEAVALAARKPIPFASVAGGTFGITPLDPLLKPDAKKRPGISASQRNAFFDNELTRSLDRVQDAELRGQVTKLKEIAATIQERIAVTKDITRKVNLEDELASVTRQRRGVEETIAKNAADSAEAAKRAAEALRKAREEREKLLAEARLAATQSRQFRAIGLAADGSDIVPGIGNLKKQLESLTDRLGGSSVNLSSKLKSQLSGVRDVLSGEFGEATRETRERIAELFATIRGEFDKGAKGPLTKTSGLNTNKILAGLGLSTQEASELQGRLSSFNSSGMSLAGARGGNTGGFAGGRGPIVVESNVTVQLDGQTVGKSVTRSQQKRKKRNPTQRRGPNRG